MKENMSTDKKIKNLQVSISIARKEIKTKLSLLPTVTENEKIKLITRIGICEKIINIKEKELIPLKLLWQEEKPQRTTTTLSNEELDEVMQRHGISL